MGGVPTTSKTDIHGDSTRDTKTLKHKNIQCLYPGDLYPFTRRPLFVIIDSDSSYSFENIPRHFGKPVVVLMSPVELPSPYQGKYSCILTNNVVFNLLEIGLVSPGSIFCKYR